MHVLNIIQASGVVIINPKPVNVEKNLYFYSQWHPQTCTGIHSGMEGIMMLFKLKNNKMNRLLLVLLLLTVTLLDAGAQKIISLYPGKPPGSENWNWKEQSNDANDWGTKIVYNVVEPTLTVYPAQGLVNTGTAVIVAPGGGLFALSINSDSAIGCIFFLLLHL